MTTQKRVYAAIDYSFAVITTDADLVVAIDEVFAHCATNNAAAAEELRVDVHGTTSTLTTDAGRSVIDTTRVISAVVSHVNLAAAQRRSADLPVLHAGAVTRATDGSAIVFPGQSGSGKSTLVATLLQRGWRYMADELVAVRAAEQVEGYAKAITLKQGSRSVLGLSDSVDESSAKFTSSVWYRPVETFSTLGTESDATPTALIFPTFDADVGDHLKPMSVASVLTQLTQCAYLPLSGAGFDVLAHLASLIPGWRIRYSTSDGACSSVESALGRRSAIGDSSPLAVGHGQRGEPSEGVVWADLTNDIVLFNPTTNAVVHLNADGRNQWMAFATEGSMDSSLHGALEDANVLQPAG